jgi:ABC-type multidrug transport system fused ATPase/permease subunit
MTSVATLVVMFTILLEKDVTVALLSLAVVPFLYLSIRYYMSTLLGREERVKELESNLVQRLYETFAAVRLVKSFARERHEAGRLAVAGDETMAARISLTWQQSLFSALVTTITILGTAVVVIVGGVHVMRGQMTIGDLPLVIAYLGAVYGPLSAIAHMSGQFQGSPALLPFAPRPCPRDSRCPDAVSADGIRGRSSTRSASNTRMAPMCSTTSASRPVQARWWFRRLTGAGKTTRSA